MQQWAGYVTEGVNDINNQLGVNPGNVLASYEQALATKFGGIINASGSAATAPPPGSNIANGGATGGGVEITHYGYSGDPNGDSNSRNGIGNHSNQLVSGVSLAFSPDLISEYHLQVGQTVTVTMANGQVLTGRFDDTTADWLTGRVDIYDPNNTVTFSGEAVTQIDGAPAAAGYDTGVARSPLTLFTTAAMGLDGLPAFLAGVLCDGLVCDRDVPHVADVASATDALFAVAIAVSPVFFGLLLVRGLDGIASRFLTGFVAICLWPLGWGIASLITNLLLDFALNTANNLGLGAVNYLSGGVLWWIGLGAWTIGSTLAAPWMISRQIAAGQPGIAALLGEAGGRGLRIAYGSATYALKLGFQNAAASEGGGLGTENPDGEQDGEFNECAPITTAVRVRYSRRPTA